MKKLKWLILLMICFGLLSGCSGEKAPVSVGSEAFTPLFRFTVSQGKGQETQLYSLPRSQGFLYLHPAAEGGFKGGFVSPERSISSESLLEGKGELSFFRAMESDVDRAMFLSGDGLTHALLKENGAKTTAFPEGTDFSGGLFYDSLSVIGKKDSLLLLFPVDFSETYVLADTKLLPDFDSLLAVTHNGKRIWYTTKDAHGKGSGIAFFEYGSTTPLGAEKCPFDKALAIGNTGVLFTRTLEDGGALYLFRDLETGKAASLTTEKPLDGVICDPEGKVLCGTMAKDVGGTVEVFHLEKGEKVASYTISQGTPCPSLAVDEKGETLLFGVSTGTDQVLGTLDLTQYFK